MTRYFTTRAGALKRLIGLQRAASEGALPRLDLVGTRKDGVQVQGVANALVDLRAGRLACYLHSSPVDQHLVFIT
jgi:hypothetical protein